MAWLCSNHARDPRGRLPARKAAVPGGRRRFRPLLALLGLVAVLGLCAHPGRAQTEAEAQRPSAAQPSLILPTPLPGPLPGPLPPPVIVPSPFDDETGLEISAPPG